MQEACMAAVVVVCHWTQPPCQHPSSFGPGACATGSWYRWRHLGL